MTDWNPSPEYEKTAEANRQYYARTAEMHDATETCVTDLHFQNMLGEDLDHILTLLNHQDSPISVLDACGGSGNVALKLLSRGADVQAADEEGVRGNTR